MIQFLSNHKQFPPSTSCSPLPGQTPLPCTVELHHHPRALRGEVCGLCWAQSGRRRRCPSHTTLRPDPALVRVQQHRDVAAEQRLLCSRSMRWTRVVRCGALPPQNLLMRRLPLLLARHAAVMVIARATVHNMRDAERGATAALAGSKPTRPHPALSLCSAQRRAS